MPDSETINRLHAAFCTWKAGWTPTDLTRAHADLLHILDCISCPHTQERHEGEPIGIHCRLVAGHPDKHQYPRTY